MWTSLSRVCLKVKEVATGSSMAGGTPLQARTAGGSPSRSMSTGVARALVSAIVLSSLGVAGTLTAVTSPGTAGAVGSSGSSIHLLQATSPVASHYAQFRPICGPPAHGRGSCTAMRVVQVPKATAGAVLLSSADFATGPGGGLTPSDLATAYDLNTTASGAGQTVGIVDAYNDPNINSDLQVFDGYYGLTPCSIADGCLRVVSQSGGTTSGIPNDTTGWTGEIALDVETVHALCPNCKIILVEANSNSGADLGASEDEAVTLGATVVNNSFTGNETNANWVSESDFNHPGTVIVASSGDCGWDAATCSESAVPPLSPAPGTPASFPTVVSVGGTILKINSNATRNTEVVASKSGSGCSTLYRAKSWQTSLRHWRSTGCRAFRLDNDVSADSFTPLSIYSSYYCGTACLYGWQSLGGTSLSAPIIAAIFALAGGAHRVKYPASTLYANHGHFYDVTSGNNGGCGTLACRAGVGYDGPSGVGAPNGISGFIPRGRQSRHGPHTAKSSLTS